MRVGSFSVQIPEGVERDSGHVVLDHGRQYTIRLGNHVGRPCDATVTVDGKSLGGFRVYANNYITLERGTGDRGRFTFYAQGTAESTQTGGDLIAASEKGVIQVRFVPEKRRERPVETVKTSGSLRSRGPGGQSMGGDYPSPTSFAPKAEEKTSGGILRGGLGLAPGNTGLSGHSSQQFTTVDNLDGDESEAVTISIRLVSNSETRPLKAVQPQANRVPDPV